MQTEIIKIKGDWNEVVNGCRATVGKPDLDHEPSANFKRNILIAEHSPIRGIIVKWRWAAIKSWIATHWSRHKWECFIATQRSDRTGVSRDDLPQSSPVDFTGEANAQHLIDTMRKRLCGMAHPETREYAEDFKTALLAVQPEISDVLVPNCVYRCGCPEMKTCGFWDDFADWCEWHSNPISSTLSVQERYDLYNRYFKERHRTGRNPE